MNEKEYLEKLMSLSDKLLQVSKARPYDPVAYNAIIDELNNTKRSKHERRRRRPWLMILLLWILFGALVGLIFRILFLT